MADAPTPDDNLVLRQLAGMRRDMAEMMERQARSIELQNRLVLRVDEAAGHFREQMAYLQRDMHLVRSDLVDMENRVLTAITEVRNIAARLDDPEHA